MEVGRNELATFGSYAGVGKYCTRSHQGLDKRHNAPMMLHNNKAFSLSLSTTQP